MTDRSWEKENDWVHSMVIACRQDPNNADINVVKLYHIIEQIRADEREACAKVAEEEYERQIVYYPKGYSFDPNKLSEFSRLTAAQCAKAIRAGGNHD